MGGSRGARKELTASGGEKSSSQDYAGRTSDDGKAVVRWCHSVLALAGVRGRNPQGWERAAKARLLKLKTEKLSKHSGRKRSLGGGGRHRDTVELEGVRGRCSQPLTSRLRGYPGEGDRNGRMTSVHRKWATSGGSTTQGATSPRAGPGGAQ